MRQFLSMVTVVVDDYDIAIAYYTRLLGFTLLEDTDRGAGKRWVRVGPPGSGETSLLLAQAVNEAQRAAIGNQTGGRVALFLETDDFWRDYERMRSRGVRFAEEPRVEPYATVAVFVDHYGNRWDLLQSSP